MIWKTAEESNSHIEKTLPSSIGFGLDSSVVGLSSGMGSTFSSSAENISSIIVDGCWGYAQVVQSV